MMSPLFDYFDRVAIVHLPERVDRFETLKAELAGVGLNIDDTKVEIPAAPMPSGANGFPSRGVYGNFLSHLSIIEKAYAEGLETVLVLEDDAIFSNAFNGSQAKIARCLSENTWDQVFLGHSNPDRLPFSPSGLVQFAGDFFWAHCYAVHRRIMASLIDYMRMTIERDAGDPLGGKMYIDGAYTLFRRLNPSAICLLSSPRLSVQRGSPSSLNPPTWYVGRTIVGNLMKSAHYMRDEAWRHGFLDITPKAKTKLNETKSAAPWP